MPCYDHRDAIDATTMKRDLDRLTRMLCSVMAVVERNRYEEEDDEDDCDLGDMIPNEVWVWWNTHKKFDKERKDRVRKDALLKLTAEEREVLGIK